jgi:hypothetical protein
MGKPHGGVMCIFPILFCFDCCNYFHEVIDLDLICSWIFIIILHLWQENMLVLRALGWMVLKCLHVALQLTLSPQR